MKSFAEALSTPEMGKLIAASLERDEKRSEEALRWLLGDEGYERMRRSVEVDQIADRFVGVPTTPSPGSGWDPIGGRPVSPDLEASATHGVGSTPSQPIETKPHVPRVGDRVRVVRGEPHLGWVGSTGRVVLDLHGVEGREEKPWNVKIDGVPRHVPYLGSDPVIALGEDEIEVIGDDGVGSTRTPGALDSMQVSPTVGPTNGELLDVRVTFDGSPGLELRLTARALHELVDFAGAKLGIRCSG